MGLITSISSVKSSHPSRVRGLKPETRTRQRPSRCIAPFTGAWIETVPRLLRRDRSGIAPFTGAWIETRREKGFSRSRSSHPSRVRGLKHSAWSAVIEPDDRTLHGCVD